MIIRRYINGKKVDVPINVTIPQPQIVPNTPTQPTPSINTQVSQPPPTPTKKGCGCRK